MRRTGNTSFSPAIGMVTAGTAKIDFGPDCASAMRLAAAVPASASAPVARSALRSTVSMAVLRIVDDLEELSTARPLVRQAGLGFAPRHEKGPRKRGPFGIHLWW